MWSEIPLAMDLSMEQFVGVSLSNEYRVTDLEEAAWDSLKQRCPTVRASDYSALEGWRAEGRDQCILGREKWARGSSQYGSSIQDLLVKRWHMGKMDASAFFHSFALPEALQPYFTLPPIWSADLGLPGPPRVVYPLCLTMPMGWTHAVFIAQTAHLHVLLRPAPDGTPSPLL
eukprot:TRINITY_DN1059_c0_g4_i1.p7 TRINITY_DN1059_c0_g4~~TRINITY_DN1059_c0_g4_i1.p7  ORF type:complete len:173 (+),score=11.22 TRINITY_DN1059_c0_g4_i1:1042-1560(+)